MRIAIDFRFLSAGPNTIRRGFGRYTQQQLREVLRQNSSDTFLLLYNERCDLSAMLPEILARPNIELTKLPRTHDPVVNLDARHPAALAEFELFLKSIGAELFHSTTQFLMNDLLVPRLGSIPTVATHYDLIPLVFPDHYLPAQFPEIRRMYRKAMRLLETADRLIAISHFARLEAQQFLGRASSSIDVAWPIADPQFRRFSKAEAQLVLESLRHRHGFGERFFLGVTAYHHSKNFELLASAYAALPSSMRSEFPLLLASYTDESEAAVGRALCNATGIQDSVIFTGEVTDTELAALYSSAAALIHPSRYEGFGLPVLEAMRCGATVITTAASSLPEVCGDAGIIVSESDSSDLSNRLLAIAEGRGRDEEFAQRAIEQSMKFTGANLGESTLAAYERAARPKIRSRRRRIAMWSPLPPQRSGISTYTVDLATALASDYEVEFFIRDGVEPTEEIARRWPVHHQALFDSIDSHHAFDLSLYQLGAWPIHEYIGAAALRRPGIVTLHDLTWGAMLYQLLSSRGRGDEIMREIRAHEGEEALDEFVRLPGGDHRAMARSEYFETHHLLGGFFDRSLAVITHMPAVRESLEKRYAARNLHSFPLCATPPGRIARGESDAERRSRTGYHADDLLIGAFGFGGHGKQLDMLVDAFAAIARSNDRVHLALVGEFLDADLLLTLQRRAQTQGVGGRVRFPGFVDSDTFDRLLLTSEIVVNLRNPRQQQMSATLMRAFAAARPVIVSDLSEWGSIPDDTCRRVPQDTDATTLAAAMASLLDDRAERIRLGAAAEKHYQESGTVPVLADRYRRVMDGVIGRPRG